MTIHDDLTKAEATLTVSMALYAAAVGDDERVAQLAAHDDPDVIREAFTMLASWTAATVRAAVGSRSATIALLADSAEAAYLEAAYAVPETGAHAVLEDEKGEHHG